MNCLFRCCCHIDDHPESPKMDIIDNTGRPLKPTLTPLPVSKVTAMQFIRETYKPEEIQKPVLRNSLDTEQKKKAESIFNQMLKDGI